MARIKIKGVDFDNESEILEVHDAYIADKLCKDHNYRCDGLSESRNAYILFKRKR